MLPQFVNEPYADFSKPEIRQAQEQAIIKMNERHAKLGFDMQEKGWKGIEHSEPNVEEGRKLVETGTKIERTARGEASIEVNTNISGELKTGITLDPDIAKQVGKLIAKMESETETEESHDLEKEEHAPSKLSNEDNTEE